MRLKRGKSKYKLPRGIFSIDMVYLHIMGTAFCLKQINRGDNVTLRYGGEMPEYWCRTYNNEYITLFPAPIKAWKLEIIAQQQVVL